MQGNPSIEGRLGGYGLVEGILVVTLSLVIIVAVTSVVDSTTRFGERRDPPSPSILSIETAVHAVGADLMRSSHDRIEIQSGDPDHDSVLLQVKGSPGGTLTFGAADRDGGFREGWSIRYRVLGSDLVRQVLDSSGCLRWSVCLAGNVGRRLESEKGFSVRRVGSLYTISLRVGDPGAAEGERQTTLRTSVPVD